jgi:hypothetical protein
MRKIYLGLTALFLGVAALSACSDNAEPSATSTGCSKNEECATGQFCNAQKACVAGCRTDADCTNGGSCTASTGQCAAPTGCSKHEDCATGQFCNAQKACAEGCRTDADCTNGGTCTASTGQCAAPTGCSPACTGNQVCDDHQGAGTPTCVDRCTYDGCDSSQNCNLQTGLCEIAAACDSSEYQPDTCLYGQYCSASDVCDYVAKATCSNFSSGGRTLQWNPATSTGPIITSMTKNYFGDDKDYCGYVSTEHKLFQLSLYAYNPSGFATDDHSQFRQLIHFVMPDGTEVTDADKLDVMNVLLSNDGKNVRTDLALCLPPETTAAYVAGFFFTGGNEACLPAQ